MAECSSCWEEDYPTCLKWQARTLHCFDSAVVVVVAASETEPVQRTAEQIAVDHYLAAVAVALFASEAVAVDSKT